MEIASSKISTEFILLAIIAFPVTLAPPRAKKLADETL
jgi:hypothetical protein